MRYLFFWMCSLSTASTLPNFMCKQATSWKITNIDTFHCLERYKPINTLADAVITAKFVPCENQTYQCCQWSFVFVRCFFFQICILGHSMPNEQMGYTKFFYFNEIWHTCRCHWKIKNAKIFLKKSHYLWSYDRFTHYASIDMLKFLLDSQFLSLWSRGMTEHC